MTHQSSVELEPTHSTTPDVPLSERPLVADDQNTVVTSASDVGSHFSTEIELNPSAQEIRDRLFAPPGSQNNAERGLRIGHFEVEERIGSGGMGAVFRAVDLELSRYVALKVLHPGIAADPALIARFRNEARACAQLNHDNVARVFFADEHDGIHYIAYEYAEGLTIKEMIVDQGRLSPEETVNYAIQSTLALSHVSAAGIVHRDIKPSNIILTKSGRIKVVDLGLARRDTSDSIGDITVAGTTLGTFDYIAPEQARDPRTADIRSDIYSLGCTVYHMLTGRPPYPEGTALQKLLDHQGKTPPDPRLVFRDIPQELSIVVQKMMNTDPTKRYQDPGQLLADLLGIAGKLGLRSVPAEGIVWRRMAVTRVRELSGALFLTGAVLVLCATALIIHFTSTPPQTAEGELRAIVESILPPNARANSASGPVSNNADVAAADQSLPTANGPSTNGDDGAEGSNDSPPETVDAGTSKAGAGTNMSATAGTDGTTGRHSPAAVPTPPAAKPFRIVRADRTEQRVESLNQAWTEVRSGDEILLDFEGALPATTSSLARRSTGAAESITLRAAPGRRPLVEFRGEDSLDQLFYLSNNLNLTIIGVDFRINVSGDSSDEWALFRCIGANQVTLRDCTVDVKNPTTREASVFRFIDAAVDPQEAVETLIELNNVAVRGTCHLAVVAGRTNGSLKVRQSAFALNGSLLKNIGRARQIGSASAGRPGQLSVDLEHTSWVLAQPLIRMRDSEGLSGGDQERDVPTITVTSYSNVFSSLLPDGVLVQSRGNAYLSEMRDLLVWQGSHNLYYQFGVYWDMNSASLDYTPEQYRFERWKRHWKEALSGLEVDVSEFKADLWVNPELINSTSAAGLTKLPVAAFELDKSLFYGNSNSGYKLDEHQSVPGVNTADLPRLLIEEAAPAEANAPEMVSSDDD